MYFMKKGQINLNIIFNVVIGLAVLTIILYTFFGVWDVQQRGENVEVVNLKTSIQTKILQQSFQLTGSFSNSSFSVPNGINDICFFDANKEYNRFINPQVTGLFKDDKKNNLFLIGEDGFYAYPMENLELEKNPLCVGINNNRIDLGFLSKTGKTVIETESEDAKCISVLENGPNEDKVDIVFLSFGFDDIEGYTDQVNRYINNIFFQFEPFNSNKEKFNFYRIDNPDIDCELTNFIRCDTYLLKLAASDCPNDHIVLLVDRNLFSDFIKPVRSSSIENIVKVNTADKPFVFVHEFGHGFGDLADEYVDFSYYSQVDFFVEDYVNCDNNPCNLWDNIEGTGCFRGCSLNSYFRPTRESIMRSLSSTTFGPVNERELRRRLLFYE